MSSKKDALTVRQAYDAMYNFIEHYYSFTNSDDIACLLSSMQMNLYDNKPMDDRMWNEWLKSIEKALKKPKESVDKKACYNIHPESDPCPQQ